MRYRVQFNAIKQENDIAIINLTAFSTAAQKRRFFSFRMNFVRLILATIFLWNEDLYVSFGYKSAPLGFGQPSDRQVLF